MSPRLARNATDAGRFRRLPYPILPPRLVRNGLKREVEPDINGVVVFFYVDDGCAVVDDAVSTADSYLRRDVILDIDGSAEARFTESIAAFINVFESLGANTVSTEWLTSYEAKHPIFPWINYRIFSKKR